MGARILESGFLGRFLEYPERVGGKEVGREGRGEEVEKGKDRISGG